MSPRLQSQGASPKTNRPNFSSKTISLHKLWMFFCSVFFLFCFPMELSSYYPRAIGQFQLFVILFVFHYYVFLLVCSNKPQKKDSNYICKSYQHCTWCLLLIMQYHNSHHHSLNSLPAQKLRLINRAIVKLKRSAYNTTLKLTSRSYTHSLKHLSPPNLMIGRNYSETTTNISVTQ